MTCFGWNSFSVQLIYVQLSPVEEWIYFDFDTITRHTIDKQGLYAQSISRTSSISTNMPDLSSDKDTIVAMATIKTAVPNNTGTKSMTSPSSVHGYSDVRFALRVTLMYHAEVMALSCDYLYRASTPRNMVPLIWLTIDNRCAVLLEISGSSAAT